MTDHRHHWALAPDLVMLNHGSFGACPRVVLEAQAELRAELEREPVRFLGREVEDRYDSVRAELGPFLGAAPEDLTFVPNATTAINGVVHSFELEAGDEVIVTDHGYNACTNAVDLACARTGAKRVTANLPFPVASEDEVVEGVLAAVTPRTRLALLDHITSPTAMVLPIKRIAKELRARGVETLIDGAHAPGQIPLNLEELGVGYATGNLHKWLCTPKGSAYLWVRRDLQPGVLPPITSHGANDGRPGLGRRSRYLVEFDWMGTSDPTAVLAVPAALRFLSELLPGGFSELLERNHRLALEGRELLCRALDIPAPTPDSMVGMMAAVPLPDGEPVETPSAFCTLPIKDRLYDRYRVEVPVMPWPAAGKRLLRFSVHAYNDRSDVLRLIEALTAEGLVATDR